MKFNQWTLGLAALGVVSLASAARADEKPSPVMTALSSTTLSGYVDTSAQWNLGTGNANNPAYAFGGASKADGFNLNVVKITLAKDADAADSWGAGYKVDLLFGPDANTLATQSTTSTGAGDFAVKQAYVDLKAPVGNGIDFKIGVWDTIIGYEVFDSGSNPNFTRSYGYSIEPTTHTGVLASYQINDMISVAAGIANTYGPTINGRATSFGKAESYKTYMADVAFTAPTNWGWAGGSTIYACVINGFNAASPSKGGAAADQTSFYIGSTLNTPVKELKLGISYDYAGVSAQRVGGAAVAEGYANATALYATYQLTEKLSFNSRGEWFTQSKANTAIPGILAAGLPSKVLALTETVQYDLGKNVLSRLELRW
ncbi:MAG TPA: outer membrane beta-barrel protein, partial [Verrucomicrobiae bacterium]|nr:outer membrane beta-barrel protein [Verrucomicrobiae bacterium]